ncbi:uncharacterized protein At4g15545 isoform X2 [Amborella trichopoda]|uniref:uncharacterized protein At4g15545 isoform X2 n=1 Tax=Amborella trichopoda TaxID=13333 RepID=UPI0009BD228B|nr:uncharacterized protein At4g15545 isoform X2 [Amborella trichopoda]|eukprot:XP_020523602.1 uncharacterized protein At4g15545 isoform X2 [Amborella trichopoda]
MAPEFELPEALRAVLPADPYEQLDVARRITSTALSTRIAKLEDDMVTLREAVQEREEVITQLQENIEKLEVALEESSEKLAKALEEKEKLAEQNISLSNNVNKLNRDVAKLEIFKKTLMQSLQEEEEPSQTGAAQVSEKKIPDPNNISSRSLLGEDDAGLQLLKPSELQTQVSDTGNSASEDGSSTEPDSTRYSLSRGLSLASQGGRLTPGGTPRLTPPGSPPRVSASVSPTISSKPTTPQRHSISVSTSRAIFDDRSSIFSSMPTSHTTTTSGSPESGSHTARARVDGKEFFRQVRSRLSYEQFGAFLANVKELNSHKQSREETLRKADEIFGPDNKDLYIVFEGLISRNVQ